MSDKYTVIIDGARTPIGMKNGKLIGMRSDDLSAILIKQLLERNGSISHKNIEDIVMGCAFSRGTSRYVDGKRCCYFIRLTRNYFW